MKIKLLLIVFIGLLAISQNAEADPCLGTTVIYPYEQGFGEYKVYLNAVNADGTIPSQQHVGPYSRDLSVTWNKLGPGKVYYHYENISGFIFEYFITVNVVNCLSFTSVPTALCNGNSRSFTLSDTNGSTSYTYTVPTGWNINGGSNTLTTSATTITVNVSGSAVNGLNAITVSSNNSGTRTYDIWTGAPIAGNAYTIYPTGKQGVNPVSLPLNTLYDWYADPVPNATSYTWTLPAGFTWGSGSQTAADVKIKTANAASSVTMYCQAINTCGSSNLKALAIIVKAGGVDPLRMAAPDEEPIPADVKVELQKDMPYPNPASDVFEVSLSESSAIRMIDANGKNVFNESAEGKISISLKNISNGLYYLGIHNSSGIKYHKVIVMH